MKVCLTHSLKQFEVSSHAIVLPIIIIIIIAGLDTLPGKDISHIDNVENCCNGDGRHGEDWSKEEDQKFPALGVLLDLVIPSYSNDNIGQSHGDKDYAEDDGSPCRVAVVNEGFAIEDIGTNVKEE